MKQLFGMVILLVPLTVLSAVAGDWPQWRGPGRDGHSTDTDLIKQWPAGGPRLAWKTAELGKGYSGVSVAGDRLYTMGDKDAAGFLLALSAADGKVLWSAKIGAAGSPHNLGWRYPGPRSTPTVSDDLVFAVDAWGELICVSAADGKELWRKRYREHFGGKPPTWGYSESPLADGDQVVVTPGGTNGAMVALDRKTGRLLWQSRDFTDDVHYSSIVLADIDGTRQYVQLTAVSVVGISAKDGALLWRVPRQGGEGVVPTPIVAGNKIYVTSGYGDGCNLYEITASAGKSSAKQVYANKVMVNLIGGVVKVDEYLYGYSDGKGFSCQNFTNGGVVWAEREKIKKASVSYADGMLFCREEVTGTVILLAASPRGYTEMGRIKQPERRREGAWTHPTIANGRLYLRDQDLLLCYQVK
jgi:outer membrane protein assembly factor BamB